jgi:hypothetical protein
MHIGTNRFSIIVVLAVSLLLPTLTFAQTGAVPNHDWSALNTAASGSKLVVKLKNGTTVEGKLSSVSDTALSLTVKGKPVDLKREDVDSVHQLSRKSATKATLIGMGIGAGAGAGIGAAGSGNDNGFEKLDRAVTAGLAVLGAGAGAITGYLIGRSGKKRVLIYEAKQP